MTAEEIYKLAQENNLVFTPPNKTRKRPHVMLRHCIMYELNKQYSLDQVGVMVGKLYKTKKPYNHATVINAIKMVTEAHYKRNDMYFTHDQVSKYIRQACLVLGVEIKDKPDHRLKSNLQIFEVMQKLHFMVDKKYVKAYFDEDGFYYLDRWNKKVHKHYDWLVKLDDE